MEDDQVYKILEQICQNNGRSYAFPDRIKNYLTVDKFSIFQYFLDASLRYLQRDLSDSFGDFCFPFIVLPVYTGNYHTLVLSHYLISKKSKGFSFILLAPKSD